MKEILEKVKDFLVKEYDLPPLKVWHFIVAVLAIIGFTAWFIL